MCASVIEEDAVGEGLKGTDAAAHPHRKNYRVYTLLSEDNPA